MRETRATRARTQQALAQTVKPGASRPPLGETAANATPSAVEQAVAKPATRLRTSGQSGHLGSSPARRIAVVIKRKSNARDADNSSPPPAMHRSVLGTSQNGLALAQEILIPAPSKNRLGSPMRRINGEFKQQDPSAAAMSPLKRPAQRIPVAPTTQQATPVKSPAKQTFGTIPRAAADSPLKKPPTRFLHNTPSRMTAQRAFAEDDAEEVDELSLPIGTLMTGPRRQPPSTARALRPVKQLAAAPPARLLHSPSRPAVPVPNPKPSTLLLDVDDDDDDGDDELAIQQLTPQVLPTRSAAETPSQPPAPEQTGLYSPPTEADLQDDWQPSLGLSKNFSELTLQQAQQVQSAKTIEPTHSKSPNHLFFDDTGSVLPVAASKPTKTEAEEMVLFIDVQSTGALADSHAATDFGLALEQLGCRVLTRWNWNPDTQTPARSGISLATLAKRVGVTHVVFFNGSARTLRKVQQARRMDVAVKCCGLSWAVQCRKLGRLTVGTAGHEIDVEAELNLHKETTAVTCKTPVTSPVKTAMPKTPSPQQSSSPEAMLIEDLIMEEYLEPVYFDDELANMASTTIEPTIDPALLAISSTQPTLHKSPEKSPSKQALALPPRSTAKTQARALQQSLTDLEERGLQLARRNSFKFKPRLSSPLAKKHWRV